MHLTQGRAMCRTSWQTGLSSASNLHAETPVAAFALRLRKSGAMPPPSSDLISRIHPSGSSPCVRLGGCGINRPFSPYGCGAVRTSVAVRCSSSPSPHPAGEEPVAGLTQGDLVAGGGERSSTGGGGRGADGTASPAPSLRQGGEAEQGTLGWLRRFPPFDSLSSGAVEVWRPLQENLCLGQSLTSAFTALPQDLLCLSFVTSFAPGEVVVKAGEQPTLALVILKVCTLPCTCWRIPRSNQIH